MKKNWIVCLLLCFCAGVLFPGTESFAKEEKIAYGIYAGEVNLSNLSETAAEQAVRSYVEEKAQGTIVLKAGEESIEIALSDLGFSWSNEEIIKEAIAVGKSGNPIKRYKEMKELEVSNLVYPLTYTADQSLVETTVTEKCTKFNKKAKDLGLKREGGEFVIIEGEDGVKVSEAESVDKIINYIENEFAEEDRTVELVTEIEKPKGTKEDLAKVKDVLGTFSTSFSSSGAGRSKNVRNGASLINGTVVYPGETFSTYEYVSPFTERNGYAMAGSYLNGKVVDSLGGGICQVSSTLYNAVLRAEMEVVERAPHSMMVGYVQPSADAAIAGTYKDFKFKNDTDAPIYIEGSTSSNKTITFTIYGHETRPSNRTIKYTNKVLSTTPASTVLVADGGHGIGYRAVESGHNGCVAELYKEVYIDGVLQSSTKVNKSTYQVSNRTVVYGIVGDEAQSAQLQACIAANDEAGANAVLGM
ncbi:MAG: VanW family protein [Lachnospiraceae bacterium]